MAELHIHLPERSDDELSEGLRALTRAICAATGDDGGYGMGGEFGYGANYANDVFAMHRNCWCDSEECPWCSYSEEHGRYFQERHRVHGAEPGGIGSGAAPNFWHKPSSFKIWWYKWIGRDNEVMGGCNFAAMLQECVSSLAPPLNDKG